MPIWGTIPRVTAPRKAKRTKIVFVKPPRLLSEKNAMIAGGSKKQILCMSRSLHVYCLAMPLTDVNSF